LEENVEVKNFSKKGFISNSMIKLKKKFVTYKFLTMPLHEFLEHMATEVTERK
jgi:hypothetical protein